MTETATIPEHFELIPCPMCDASRWMPARSGRDWNQPDPRLLYIVRCEECGLHFTNPRPRLDHLGDFYRSDYAPHQAVTKAGIAKSNLGSTWRLLVARTFYGSPQRQPGWPVRQLAEVMAAVRGIESFGFGIAYGGNGRLLDFGCGSGRFLQRMAQVGWNVTGIDFSISAVEAARAAGLRALHGSMPHAELVGEQFDAITLRHSLEHVPNPLQILRELKQLLSPEGRLVVQVPNFDSWEIEYFGDAARTLDLPRHLLHFTPATLEAMLHQAGFSQVRLKQTCRTDSLRKSLAQVERRGGIGELDKALGRKSFLKKMARRAQRLGKGNELLAVARV